MQECECRSASAGVQVRVPNSFVMVPYTNTCCNSCYKTCTSPLSPKTSPLIPPHPPLPPRRCNYHGNWPLFLLLLDRLLLHHHRRQLLLRLHLRLPPLRPVRFRLRVLAGHQRPRLNRGVLRTLLGGQGYRGQVRGGERPDLGLHWSPLLRF